MIVWVVLGWFLALNALAFAAFGVDKRRAVRGDWRLSESYLLLLALLGGWAGAKAGQRRFRHKTRKEPFRTTLNLFAVCWIAVGAGVLAVAASERWSWPQPEPAVWANSPEPRDAPHRFFKRVGDP